MNNDLMTGELVDLIARGNEVQHLAGRVAVCAGRVGTVLARFREIQLLEWQSPAGRAYRNSIALQEVALGQALARLEDARLAVNRHAQEVGPSSGGSPAGQYRWPR
jgi:MarR-like DNA-binding transcriptional regulator SgrR of sgrS sRNA